MHGSGLAPRHLVDGAIAVALAGVGCYLVLVTALDDDVVEGPVWLNVSTVLLCTVPLVWRRRAPLLVALVVLGALGTRALVAIGLDAPLEIYPPAVAALVAVYSVAHYAQLRDAVLGLAFATLAVSVAVVGGSGTDSAPDPIATPILYLVIWTVGLIGGNRVRGARALYEAREEYAAGAVDAERIRIAQDLHDSVSHSLAVIAMQAGGAQNILSSDPERARASLASIETAARTGLEEMRRMLGLIGSREGPLEPPPGLQRLDTLLDDVRATGVQVESVITGIDDGLPATVDASAYRIIQEGLTNVLKHAGPCTVDLMVRGSPGAVTIEIRDDGAGVAEGGDDRLGGRGLIGMAERAQIIGGTVEACPRRPGPGFEVIAWLPR